MSLARAMTKRIKRTEVPNDLSSPPPPTRSQSVKMPGARIDRSKISLPVTLVSTTNMLSYNAPDIATMRHPAFSASRVSSADDSDHSVSTRSRASSHSSRDTTLTDASSVESSPISPARNYPAGHFPFGDKQLRKSASTTSLQRVKEEPVEPVPAIPQRALSHSKRAHERLARKRSLQNVNNSHGSLNSRGSMGSQRSSREQRSSADIFKGVIEEPAHPFGRELEQLNEIVEEFGGVVRDAETNADLTIMRAKNLAAFCAADYLAEIRPLFSNRFATPHHAPRMAWI